MTHGEELASLPLSDRIVRLIADSGMKQEDFADAAGIARETVSRWLNYHTRPDKNSRPKLAALASELYGEPVSPDLFREHVPPRRRRPPEMVLEEIVETSTRTERRLQELERLLTEQRQLVAEMSRLVRLLERSLPAHRDEGAGG